MVRPIYLASLLSTTLYALTIAFDFDSACGRIASQAASIANATIFFADLVPAGTNLTFPDQDPSCASTTSFQVVLADMCRVSLNVSTSDRSGITMETWLPRNWTGRFLSTGNGGLDGCIQYVDIAYTTALGFASVAANNGHNGTSGELFFNNPDVLADFVYRSIHTNVVVGKDITQMFYDTPHNTSYYLGCSTGGREGFKSVQNFPDDFDGVVAGSPAVNFNNLMSWSARFYNILGNSSSPTFITSDQWLGLIHDNILKQCDTIDGVADGIIEDPNLCDYKPEELICSPNTGTNNSDCLTVVQAAAVRQVFSPMYDLDGNLMFPRQQPGSENADFIGLLYGGEVFEYSRDWFHYVVFNPSFDVKTANLTDYTFVEKLNPFNIATFNGNLSDFQSRGGKVLTYHGQADMLISPADTELWYNHIAETMGLPPSDIDQFMRFFRISGMSHCANGVGAWEIGQTLPGASGILTSETLDPERNVLTAMVRWVEEGVAPDRILGTKHVNDTTELGVEFRRRHCRYPLRSTYDRKGNSSDPDSWTCQ
ncbi:Tannase/feruloyl esterase [Lentinula aciculospora]|uniref:Carboxylic ester hydrolase n=1 Tax=Lentinula aciculospora TaxID=153920 RepID=A0A9W9A5D4_9AGAR|nr:Tannase/feruloyl esterase [Lentinula aciculospora]